MPDASAPNGDVYIVSAARTPIGKFGGAWPTCPRRRSAASPSAPRSSAPACRDGRRSTRCSWARCSRPASGQAPARQAALKAGLPDRRQRDDDQPRLRLGPEGDHARRGGDPRRRRRDRRRRRHGEHEPGPVPDAQGALRLPAGQRRADRRDRPRRPVVRDRGVPHGHARRARGDQGAGQPRRPGRVRAGEPPEGRRGHRRGPVRGRDRAGAGPTAAEEDALVDDRRGAAPRLQPRGARPAQARLRPARPRARSRPACPTARSPPATRRASPTAPRPPSSPASAPSSGSA